MYINGVSKSLMVCIDVIAPVQQRFHRQWKSGWKVWKKILCAGNTKIFSLENRTIRGEVIEVYKIISDLEKTDWDWLFTVFLNRASVQNMNLIAYF